jgi:putative ABC transport system ATP-binding protein
MTVVEVRDVWRIYRLGKVDVPAVRGISLRIEEGEFLAIVGPSGCGKTTLLNLLGGLDRPTRGSVILDGLDLARASEHQLVETRRHKVGFVFQTFHLVPTLTAFENVLLPLRYARVDRRRRRRLGEEALAQVGLSERMHHLPLELSGGEQQRVAIARAIVHDPLVVLADEPTGELDSATTQAVVRLMQKINDQRGKTFIIVTHNLEVANATERVVLLTDGTVAEDRRCDRSVRAGNDVDQ